MPVRHEANIEIYRSARIIVHGHTHKRERERGIYSSDALRLGAFVLLETAQLLYCGIVLEPMLVELLFHRLHILRKLIHKIQNGT
jgi:hypothetical protein